MYLVRDIFHLKFGQYKEVNALLKEARDRQLFPSKPSARILTDFTGASYRLIFEEGFDRLADFEEGLASELSGADWQEWYARFKTHVAHGEREILKQWNG